MMPNRKPALALLACMTLLGACGKTEAPAGAPAAAAVTTVKIGLAAPLTGPQAHLGKDMQYGAQMAIDAINAGHPVLGGQPVVFELQAEDDMADPRTATTVAQKFVDEGVNGIIGHMNSGATIPASKIYNSSGVVQISPSATAVAYTAQGYANAFRVMANDSQQGKDLGLFAVQKLGARHIAIIDDRTAYGQGLADEFAKAAQEAGGTIVTREFTSDKATDFNAILTSIKGRQPDLVFFGGMDGQGASMVRQMHALGMTMPFMGGDGVHTGEFIKLAGSDAEGAIGSLPGVPLEQMPGGVAFQQAFEAKYGKIQLYAPYSYDAVQVMVAAMQKAGSSESAKYLPALAALQHRGVTATITFDGKGDLNNGSVSIYKVANGQWQLLETVGAAAPAAAPAQP